MSQDIRHLRARHNEVMEKVRSGEGIIKEELDVLGEYARAMGSTQSRVDYASGKASVKSDKNE